MYEPWRANAVLALVARDKIRLWGGLLMVNNPQASLPAQFDPQTTAAFNAMRRTGHIHIDDDRFGGAPLLTATGLRALQASFTVQQLAHLGEIRFVEEGT